MEDRDCTPHTGRAAGAAATAAGQFPQVCVPGIDEDPHAIAIALAAANARHAGVHMFKRLFKPHAAFQAILADIITPSLHGMSSVPSTTVYGSAIYYCEPSINTAGTQDVLSRFDVI